MKRSRNLPLFGWASLIMLCAAASLAAPEKVFDYWPGKPGEYSTPKSVFFASKSISTPEAVLADDGQAVILKEGQELIVDFGADVGGFFEFKVNESSPAKVLISYSEAAKFAKGERDFITTALSSYRKLTERTYTIKASGWFQDPVLMGGARYARVKVQKGELALDAVRCKNTFLQCDPSKAGWFLTDDELLNKIWYASYYTVCLDTIHSNQGGKSGREKIGEGEWVIVDGAKRDRLIWSGDLAVANRSAYVTNGRYDIARDTLLSLAHWQYPNGIYPACSRVELGKSVAKMFIEYSLWQVVNSYEYYLYSGDREFLAEIYPGLVKAMEYHDSRTSQGLLFQVPFKDGMNYSYGILRTGYMAYLNALYYLSLHAASQIAISLDEFGQSQIFLSRADRIEESFNSFFWDDKKGAYVDIRFDKNHHALDGNALAVISNLADDAKTEQVIKFFNTDLKLQWGDRQFDRSYFFPNKIPFTIGHNARFVMPLVDTFDAIARYHAGYDVEAIDLIRRCWGDMVNKDPNFTTWEWIGKKGVPDSPMTSLAHAWSAGASFVLSEKVLGVVPLEAGYKSYKIEPHTSSLLWAQGAVPSPRGDISVKWKSDPVRFELEMDVPKGRGPSVSLPRKGEHCKVWLDGELISTPGKETKSEKIVGSSSDKKYLSFELAEGGKHKLVIEKTEEEKK